MSEELLKKRGRTEVFALPIGSHGAHRQARVQMSTLVCTAGAITNRMVHFRAPVARAPLAIGPINRSIEEERRVQVLVRDNNIDQAKAVRRERDDPWAWSMKRIRLRERRPLSLRSAAAVASSTSRGTNRKLARFSTGSEHGFRALPQSNTIAGVSDIAQILDGQKRRSKNNRYAIPTRSSLQFKLY